MEYVWNTYGTTRQQHASNTPATRQQHASSKLGAGCGCRGGTEGIRRAGGVEKLDQAGGGGGIRWGWAGRDRKKEAEVKLPARGFDWVPDGIPGSNLSDEPLFPCILLTYFKDFLGAGRYLTGDLNGPHNEPVIAV